MLQTSPCEGDQTQKPTKLRCGVDVGAVPPVLACGLEGSPGGFLDPACFCLELGGDYIGAFTLWKLIGMYIYNYCTFVCVIPQWTKNGNKGGSLTLTVQLVSSTPNLAPAGYTHVCPKIFVNQILCFHVLHTAVLFVLDFILNFKPGLVYFVGFFAIYFASQFLKHLWTLTFR